MSKIIVKVHTVYEETFEIDTENGPYRFEDMDPEAMKQVAMSLVIEGEHNPTGHTFVGTYADAHPGMYKDTVEVRTNGITN